VSGKKGQITNKKGQLVIISGPSGSGKTTICDRLKENLCIQQSVSYTTRKPRGAEKNGIDYHFINKTRFIKLIEEEKLIEYAEYCGFLYGTPIEPVEEAIKNGRTFILAIDVQGALQVKRKISNMISIFIMPPGDEVLQLRLEKRLTDNKASMQKRLKLAKEELKYSKYYDYCVINDQLDDTIERIKRIINIP